MSRDDWYRSGDWSPSAREAFEQRLRRSRTPFHKAQYLKFKAIYLLKSEDSDAHQGGYELLHRVINEYPDERLMVLDSLELLGRAHEADGRFEEAEAYYRRAISYSHSKWHGYLPDGSDFRLAQLILRTEQADKYGEAGQLLDSVGKELLLNSQVYDHSVAQARLYARLGDPEEASRFAQYALRLAQETEPQFSRHPKVGLVKAFPSELDEMRMLIEGLSVSPRAKTGRNWLDRFRS